jgi:anaerobic magnesium-protoporphyrin IX monomethyl ester cyclase
MKILLIKPKAAFDTIIPPLGLGYLAKGLIPKHDVRVLDCQKNNVRQKDLPELVNRNDPDVVGIQVYNNDRLTAKQYIHAIKKEKKDLITIIGGPHPSCEPENVFDFFGRSLDFAFRGEAELGFESLVDKISGRHNHNHFKSIGGLIWRENGSTMVNEPTYPKSFNEIGAPAWDLLRPDSYPPTSLGAFLKDYPVAPINISRGCRFTCNFCSGWKITGRHVRYRSIENVIDEIKLLIDKFAIREIHILDENFAYDRNYVIEFCQAVLKENLRVRFACPNGMRVESIDESMLELMRNAGFYIWHLGIESGSQKVLDSMNKGLSVERVKNKAVEIRNAGLEMCGYFIIGYPGETKNDLNLTLKLALELPLTRAMFMTFLPIPGSKVFDVIEKKCGQSMDKLRHGNFYKINYHTETLSFFRLKIFQLKAFLFFYGRPRILLKNLKAIYDLPNFFYLARRVLRILISI